MGPPSAALYAYACVFAFVAADSVNTAYTELEFLINISFNSKYGFTLLCLTSTTEWRRI